MMAESQAGTISPAHAGIMWLRSATAFSQQAGRNGFSEEQIGMHTLDGEGDLLGLVRDETARGGRLLQDGEDGGARRSMYTTYDREIAARADLAARGAQKHTAKPWCFPRSSPAFSLTAPPNTFTAIGTSRYPCQSSMSSATARCIPTLRIIANPSPTTNSSKARKWSSGPRRYFGLCSFLDENIGKVLAALSDAGLAGRTRVIYTSDHGDNLGARGLWGKSTMYQESVAVPLIVAGPDFLSLREFRRRSTLSTFSLLFWRASARARPTLSQRSIPACRSPARFLLPRALKALAPFSRSTGMGPRPPPLHDQKRRLQADLLRRLSAAAV